MQRGQLERLLSKQVCFCHSSFITFFKRLVLITGYVEHRADTDWLKQCMTMKIVQRDEHIILVLHQGRCEKFLPFGEYAWVMNKCRREVKRRPANPG